jgi:hypothetical protein
MMQHETVTMMAAVLRVRWNSSWKKEVLTSWREISEVRAASDRSR